MNSWDLVAAFAERGIVVAPGDFYGEAGVGFVRIALTASDERIAAACQRLVAEPIVEISSRPASANAPIDRSI